MLTCQNCNAGNSITARFCVSCGHAFDPSPVVPPATQQTSINAKKLCTGCRTINLAEATYCYRCGLQLPTALLPPGSAVGNPAGFWIRVGAYLIDEILIFIASVLLTVIFTEMDTEEVIKQSVGTTFDWTTTVVSTVAGVAYYTFAIGQWGQTIGKAILGLKVTRADGSRLSFQRSFARYWAYLVSAIPLGLGFIAIGLSSQKRGWHDLVCDTRVVNLRS